MNALPSAPLVVPVSFTLRRYGATLTGTFDTENGYVLSHGGVTVHFQTMRALELWLDHDDITEDHYVPRPR